MADPLPEGLLRLLSPGAKTLVEAATDARGKSDPAPGIHLWLRAILERHRPMVEDIAPAGEAPRLLARVRDALARGDAGPPLEAGVVLASALAIAQARGQARIYESDLVRAILIAAQIAVTDPAAAATPRVAPPPGAPASATGAAPASATPARSAAPKPTLPTPMLDQFGRDLTRLARDGKLGPVVGREEETDLVIETLCRRTTRNPALVGPAGVGKTAIVEGLARRIAAGQVPDLLAGTRIVELQASALVAGARFAGELEERVKTVVQEASQPGLVLFVDEVHALMGAGGMPGLSDMATQLKPALARGDIACIAATTDDEYRRFIEPDKALERRFQPLRIGEPSPAQTLEILAALASDLERVRGVAVPVVVRRWIVDFAQQFLRNRSFPAKAVDLLEQCVAHALVRGRKSVEPADAEEVGHRLIGMPTDLGTRRQNLADRLEREALLPEDGARGLLARLEVTMRGFDVRPQRPNAVVLLAGPAVVQAEPLCRAIADTLFGSEERVVQMDFGRFVHPEDITMLVGAPPGYVGYSESLPIHALAQTPWSVFRCDNVHGCHPRILEVLAQALESGYFTDSRGRRIHLSDAVVVLTAAVESAQAVTLGFKAGRPDPPAAEGDARHALEPVLGARLVAECDVVSVRGTQGLVGDREHLEQAILGLMAERYQREGLTFEWDRSVVDWLLSLRRNVENTLDWERAVDQNLGAHLARYERDTHPSGERRALVKCENGAVRIEPLPEKDP